MRLPRPVRGLASLSGLLCALLLVGCAAWERQAAEAEAAQHKGDSWDRATPADKQRWAAATSQEVAICQRHTADADQALVRALDLATSGGRDASGQAVPTLTETAANLKRLGVSVTIQNQGSPQMPMLVAVDSLAEEAQRVAITSARASTPPAAAPKPKQAKRARGTSAPAAAPPAAPEVIAFQKRAAIAQPVLASLRVHVDAVNSAMRASYTSTLACLETAKSTTHSLGAFSNGEDVTPEMFAPYVRLLDANAQSEAAAASTLAMVSVLQASLAGREPETIGKFLSALKEARTRPAVVTEAQARAAFELSGKGLRDACEAQWQASIAEHPEYNMPGPSPCSKEGSRMTASQRRRLIAAEKAKSAAPKQDADIVQHLVPSDGPVAAAVEGATAIGRGDYLGAAKSALKLVPKSTPVGAAIHGVLAILG